MYIEFSYLIGLLLILGGVIFFIFSLLSVRVDPIDARLHDFVADTTSPGRIWMDESVLRRQELQGSLLSRTILPGFRRLGGFWGSLAPAKIIQHYDSQLSIAGYPLGIRGREFYGIRLMFMALGFWLLYQILSHEPDFTEFLIASIAVYLCYFIPKAWLRGMVRRRKDNIRKSLPDALDMLSVCADAGLGFDQSLQRLSEYWKNQLGVELGRVVKEMEMGVPRQDALRNLAARLNVEELSSFIAVILQSDQLGMSIADTLHGLAKQMRIERRFRAQEQARKVPLKMLFPMMFFILPAMFAIVIGPAIPALIEFFRTLNP